VAIVFDLVAALSERVQNVHVVEAYVYKVAEFSAVAAVFRCCVEWFLVVIGPLIQRRIHSNSPKISTPPVEEDSEAVVGCDLSGGDCPIRTAKISFCNSI